MREIKFDAIYKPTGEHFTPISINFNDHSVVGNFDGEQGDWCHFSLDGKYGDVILRQYTGLKDKNGKEIYEGDLLAYKGLDGRNLNLVVKWSDRDATFLFGGVRTDYAITGEVVGDIYENPELINQEK